MGDEKQYWPKKAFDSQDQLVNDLMKAALDNARDALRAALLLNGGACIAVLGFLASLSSGTTTRAGMSLIGPAKAGLVFFAVGAALAAIASGLAYFTNSYYADANAEKQKRFDYPYIFDTDISVTKRKTGEKLHRVAVGAVIFSYCFFLMGLARAGWSL